jgi:hypothetical protein
MTLAHLRNSDTLARLAVGFAVSVSTVWRYLREAIGLLAAIPRTWPMRLHEPPSARSSTAR